MNKQSEPEPSDKGINIQKRYLEIEEALPFFPGRKGHKHMTKSSLIQKVSTGNVPKGSVIRLATGKVVFDRLKLIGNGNNAA